MDFLVEIFKYMWGRKKWWLLPMIIVLLMFAILIVLSTNPATAPFIYTIF